jgi:hypothetical protein
LRIADFEEGMKVTKTKVEEERTKENGERGERQRKKPE